MNEPVSTIARMRKFRLPVSVTASRCPATGAPNAEFRDESAG
jgi:hypothetical protein